VTTQKPKDQVNKTLHRNPKIKSTKHYTETQRLSQQNTKQKPKGEATLNTHTQKPQKKQGELWCSGRVGRSCSKSGDLVMNEEGVIFNCDKRTISVVICDT
jgi:hypothetical protein